MNDAAAPRRVLFLNNQGLSSFGGGVTILRHLATEFARDSEVTVASYDPPAGDMPWIRQETLPPPPSPGRAWRIAPLLRARHLARAVPASVVSGADLVIALDCHFAPLLRAARPRRLLYLSLSCIPRQEWFGGWGSAGALVFAEYVWLERMAIGLAHRTVVSSRFHAGEIRRFELLPDFAPEVVPPVFPPILPPVLPAEPAAAVERQNVVLCVGRLHHVKNYDVVIEMAARLRDLDWRFVMVGDGLAGRLGERARAAGVAGRFTFPGGVRDPSRLFAEASLLLHPSLYESFGMVVIEAMHAGAIPVCAAQGIGGYREFIHDEAEACIVDFRRPEQAAARLRMLMTDPARRAAMADAARQAAARVATRDYAETIRALVAEIPA